METAIDARVSCEILAEHGTGQFCDPFPETPKQRLDKVLNLQEASRSISSLQSRAEDNAMTILYWVLGVAIYIAAIALLGRVVGFAGLSDRKKRIADRFFDTRESPHSHDSTG
jgi:hypothetical protein